MTRGQIPDDEHGEDTDKNTDNGQADKTGFHNRRKIL
jgi:hypothetical protein